MTAHLPIFEDTLADFWLTENGEFVRSLGVELTEAIEHRGMIVIDVEPESSETVPVSTELVPVAQTTGASAPTISRAVWLTMAVFGTAIAGEIALLLR